MKLRIWFYQTIHVWSVRKLRIVLRSKHKYERNGFLTDHAVLRYIERKELCDVEVIRQLMMPRKVYDKIREIGGTGKFVVDDICYVVTDGTVITVYPHQPGKPTLVKDGKRIWQF